jgi:uroporphyrinogen-III decarboxylase
MTQKIQTAERLITAMQGGRPDRIPVMPKIWLDSAATLAGQDLAGFVGRPLAATRLIVHMADRLGFDGARLHLFPERRLEHGPGATWELDEAGKRIGAVDLSGGLSVEPRPPDAFDWDDPATLFALQFRPALVDDDACFDWAAVAVPDSGFYERLYGTTVRSLLDEFGGRLCCIGDCDSASLPFLSRFRGVQGAMTDLVLQPESARAAFELGIRYVVERARFFISCGCRVLRLNDSMANMNLISPAQWREFIAPVFTAAIRAIKALHPDVLVYCHICGNVMPVLADLRQTGLDCIGPMDPLGGMDLGRARDLVGPAYSLMGGVNTLTLARGTPTEVAAECRTVLAKACARDGAFILGSGCALSRLTSIANLQAMREVVDEVGR